MRFAAIFAMLPLLMPLAAAEPSVAEPAPWLTDLDQALAVADKTGQPIFIVLSCPH